MKGLLFIFALAFTLFSAATFSQDVQTATETISTATTAVTASVSIPEVSTTGEIKDLLNIGTLLVKNWKALGIWGVSSFIVVFLLTLLNNGLFTSLTKITNEWKLTTNVILSTLLAIFSGIYLGGNWVTVLINVLVVSGGATAIYSVLKQSGIIKKKA